MAKGFGVKVARKKAKPEYPLVVSLQQKLQSGELTPGGSTAWDWIGGLGEEDSERFQQIRDRVTLQVESSSDMAEMILLKMALAGMELGEDVVKIPEETIIKRIKALFVMASIKELTDAGLIETEDFPRRLVDTDRSFAVRLLKREM